MANRIAGFGRPSVTSPESVDEARCFGWIDGVRRKLDDHRYAIRLSVRRPGGIESRVNSAEAEALSVAG